MRASAFFPPGLHPVLDGCERREDPMVAPQMPTGRLVRQAVLHHQADGQRHDAVGVVGFRLSQVGHIGVEVFIALRAMVDRIGDVNFVRTIGGQIAQIVQLSRCFSIPIGTVPTAGARLTLVIPTALEDFRLWQVFDARDAFRGIGQIFAWSWHGMTLRGCCHAEMLAKLTLRVITNSR